MESDLVQRKDLKQDNTLLKANLLEYLHNRKCKKVEDLVNEAQGSDKSLPTDNVIEAIESLKENGNITLTEAAVQGSFARYITNNYYSNLAFWLTVVTISLVLVTTYILPAVGFSSIVRMISGGIAVLLIPGYGLIGLLFPKKDMTLIERIGLGFGSSLALVPLLWVVLDNSQSAVGSDLVVSSIIVADVLLISGSTYRQFMERKRQSKLDTK